MSAGPTSIAETVVYGVAFDPKNGERVAGMDLNQLFAAVGRLFDLLEEREVDYLLAGGIAMLAYVEGRNTQDIDLVMSAADLARLPELRVEEQNDRFVKAWLDDLRVDVLLAENEPFETVLARFVSPHRFADRDVPTATEEGLLLMKLFALPSLYRQGQFGKVRIYEGDIADLLDVQAEVSQTVWEVLAKTLSESDLVEVQRIVDELRDKRDARASRFAP